VVFDPGLELLRVFGIDFTPSTIFIGEDAVSPCPAVRGLAAVSDTALALTDSRRIAGDKRYGQRALDECEREDSLGCPPSFHSTDLVAS